jgi:translocation and assembly module TamB
MNGTATGELQARINNILVRKKNEFSILIDNANLFFSKTGAEDYILKGRIGLGESRLTADLTVDDMIRRLTSPRRSEKPPPEIFRQTALDMIIEGGKKIFIDNNLAKIELGTDLQIVGTFAVPVVLGSVEAIEGEIYYLDREFKITEGTIDFADRTQMNPRLNIQAETTVTSYQAFGDEKYTITIALTGNLQKPDFALSSSPPLDRPNIVSLLTLGVTREQVGIGSASNDTTAVLNDVLRQRAEVLASQQISGYLGRQIEGMLGLERVTIDGNLFNFGEKGQGPRVTAAQQLSDDIQLIYTTSMTNLNDLGFRILYDVSNNISLRGETSSQGRTGFDVLYRLRFR